jgi:hypothetical protein
MDIQINSEDEFFGCLFVILVLLIAAACLALVYFSLL